MTFCSSVHPMPCFISNHFVNIVAVNAGSTVIYHCRCYICCCCCQNCSILKDMIQFSFFFTIITAMMVMRMIVMITINLSIVFAVRSRLEVCKKLASINSDVAPPCLLTAMSDMIFAKVFELTFQKCANKRCFQNLISEGVPSNCKKSFFSPPNVGGITLRL